MNLKRGLRITYKVAIIVDLVLAGLLIWDHAANRNNWMVPLLWTLAVFLLLLIILLFVGPGREAVLHDPNDVRPDVDAYDYGQEATP